jgi:dihydroorotate dehydrogenase
MSLDLGANSTRERAGFVLGKHRDQLVDQVSARRWPVLSWRAAYRLLEWSTTRLLLNLPNAETAHEIALRGLQAARLFPAPSDHPWLETRAFGLTFPNPIGVAAGLDKDAQVVDAVLKRGFGFAEVGTITPNSQDGNPPPRVFRLRADEAIINRFGFNNRGQLAALARLRSRAHRGGVVGVNIGANKDTLDRVADYVAGIEAFSAVASYFAVNISSPNTPGLRDLQEERAFDDLLARVLEARDRATERVKRKPVLLKIAPDLSLSTLDALVKISRRRGVDGIIVSNTTVSRSTSLHDANREEIGGLSGRPLFDLSTRMLAQTFVRVEGAFPLIGVGGIDSGKSAWLKIRAGASLIQLYTALVYKGPGLLEDIKSELVEFLRLGRHEGLADVIGSDAPALTAERRPSA